MFNLIYLPGVQHNLSGVQLNLPAVQFNLPGVQLNLPDIFESVENLLPAGVLLVTELEYTNIR